MDGASARGHLDVLLLGILASGPAHGYAIIEALRERSGGVFALQEGSVYPALHRLEEEGLPVQVAGRDESGPPAAYVSVSRDAAASALGVRRRAWTEYAQAVNSVLTEPSWATAK